MKKSNLSYQAEDKFCPIPPNERNLPTAIAEHFVDIPLSTEEPEINILEGLNFDQHNHLYVCVPPQSDIYRIDMKNNEVTK